MPNKAFEFSWQRMERSSCSGSEQSVALRVIDTNQLMLLSCLPSRGCAPFDPRRRQRSDGRVVVVTPLRFIAPRTISITTTDRSSDSTSRVEE